MQLDLTEIHAIQRPTVIDFVELTAENIDAIAAELAAIHQPTTVVDGVLSYKHPHGAGSAAIGDWVSLNYLDDQEKYALVSVVYAGDQSIYQVVGFPSVDYTTQES